MKTGPDTLGPAENESGSAKHENGTDSKMSSGAHNMKTGHDALCSAENGSWSAKHESGTRRPRNRRK
jgi:hypothetical protein